MVTALYFETFCGNDYFRDKQGNIYTKIGNEVAFCSNLKQGQLTEDKSEPSYSVSGVQLVKYTHLLYVKKYSCVSDTFELFVYGVNTKDIYHTIGEMYARSLERIKRIDFTKCTLEKLAYWEQENIPVREFKDRYLARPGGSEI